MAGPDSAWLQVRRHDLRKHIWAANAIFILGLFAVPTTVSGQSSSDVMADLPPSGDYNKYYNTGRFAISGSGSVVASFEACKQLCVDDPNCTVIHYCDAGSGARAGECYAAPLKRRSLPAQAGCDDVKNAERVPVCPSQPGEPLLWNTTSTDGSLCVSSDGGRVEYTGSLCDETCIDTPESLCNIDWTHARTIDLNGGWTSDQCQWDWTAHTNRSIYAGTCGIQATTPIAKNRLPVRCYNAPLPPTPAPTTPASTLAPTPASSPAPEPVVNTSLGPVTFVGCFVDDWDRAFSTLIARGTSFEECILRTNIAGETRFAMQSAQPGNVSECHYGDKGDGDGNAAYSLEHRYFSLSYHAMPCCDFLPLIAQHVVSGH